MINIIGGPMYQYMALFIFYSISWSCFSCILEYYDLLKIALIK